MRGMDTCPTCSRQLTALRRRCYFCTGRKRTGETRACERCGAETYVQRNQLVHGEGRYCSTACKYAAMNGRERVTGTTTIARGYRKVKTGVRRYEFEHRLVVEASLGRKLDRREEVHHINGDKLDNRLENLRVVSPSEHQAIHGFGPAMRRRVTLTCEHCGATFERRPKLQGQRFCSRSCRSKATGGFATGKAHRAT